MHYATRVKVALKHEQAQKVFISFIILLMVSKKVLNNGKIKMYCKSNWSTDIRKLPVEPTA